MIHCPQPGPQGWEQGYWQCWGPLAPTRLRLLLLPHPRTAGWSSVVEVAASAAASAAVSSSGIILLVLEIALDDLVLVLGQPLAP